MKAVAGWAAIFAVIWGGAEVYQRWPWHTAAAAVVLVGAGVAWWRWSGRRADRATAEWNAALGLKVYASLHAPGGPGPVPSLVAEAERLMAGDPRAQQVADAIRRQAADYDAAWHARQTGEAR